jgi:hypothetical protein
VNRGQSLSNSITLPMMTLTHFLMDVPVIFTYIYFQGDGVHVES